MANVTNLSNNVFGGAGYNAGGASNGTSGGSAISAAGWRFNICQDPGRCRIEPADGISQWYRRLWQVCLMVELFLLMRSGV